jgi:hypothetical protein
VYWRLQEATTNLFDLQGWQLGMVGGIALATVVLLTLAMIVIALALNSIANCLNGPYDKPATNDRSIYVASQAAHDRDGAGRNAESADYDRARSHARS